MTPAAMRDLVDRYLDAYNRMDVAAMLAPLHPEVEFRHLAGAEQLVATRGKEALRTLAEQSLALFSQRRQTLTEFTVEGGFALARIDFHAVAARDLSAECPRGQVVSLAGRSEFEFREGLISRITDIT